MSVDSSECRICFENEGIDNPFISPCLCKGTSKYVHLSCLMTWRQLNRDGDIALKQRAEIQDLVAERYLQPSSRALQRKFN